MSLVREPMLKVAPGVLPDDILATRGKVLVVDDDPSYRLMVKSILEHSDFQVTLVSSGEEALEKLPQTEFDVILLDKRMPGMSGDEVCKEIRSRLGEHLLPIIMVTGDFAHRDIVYSLENGATDFIRKPFSHMELVARVKSAVNQKRITDQLESAEALIYTLARLVEARDENTGDHCSRLQTYSEIFGRELELSEQELLTLKRGCILHDIGKVAVPDRVLLKRGPLDEEEKILMKRHPETGARLCEGLKSIKNCVPIIRFHHERFDGTGYPYGLKGEEIPLLAQVFQIVDVYDALVSERPYKSALSREAAIKILRQEANQGWRNPELVNTFIQAMEKYFCANEEIFA